MLYLAELITPVGIAEQPSAISPEEIVPQDVTTLHRALVRTDDELPFEKTSDRDEVGSFFAAKLSGIPRIIYPTDNSASPNRLLRLSNGTPFHLTDFARPLAPFTPAQRTAIREALCERCLSPSPYPNRPPWGAKIDGLVKSTPTQFDMIVPDSRLAEGIRAMRTAVVQQGHLPGLSYDPLSGVLFLDPERISAAVGNSDGAMAGAEILFRLKRAGRLAVLSSNGVRIDSDEFRDPSAYSGLAAGWHYVSDFWHGRRDGSAFTPGVVKFGNWEKSLGAQVALAVLTRRVEARPYSVESVRSDFELFTSRPPFVPQIEVKWISRIEGVLYEAKRRDEIGFVTAFSDSAITSNYKTPTFIVVLNDGSILRFRKDTDPATAIRIIKERNTKTPAMLDLNGSRKAALRTACTAIRGLFTLYNLEVPDLPTALEWNSNRESLDVFLTRALLMSPHNVNRRKIITRLASFIGNPLQARLLLDDAILL